MQAPEPFTKRLVVKLPESAYQLIRKQAFEQQVAMAELARKALFKADGSLRA